MRVYKWQVQFWRPCVWCEPLISIYLAYSLHVEDSDLLMWESVTHHTYTNTHIHTHTPYTHAPTHIHAYTHTHTPHYIHTPAHIYTYMHTHNPHIHTCTHTHLSHTAWLWVQEKLDPYIFTSILLWFESHCFPIVLWWINLTFCFLIMLFFPKNVWFNNFLVIMNSSRKNHCNRTHACCACPAPPTSPDLGSVP